MTVDQSTAFTPGSAQANRVDLLNNSGHSWMPDDMQTTLAASNTPDDQLVTIADSIKNAVSQTWNGFSEALDDPVLHKQPSSSLALARYLTASIGPLPVAEPDLKQIQSKLQGDGFGKNLNVDGAWDSDWNAAYNQWLTNLKSRQVAGDKPGSISTGKAAGHWYDVFNPGKDLNAIVGYVKSVPGQVNNLLADTVSSVVDLPNELTHLVSGYHRGALASTVGAGIETGLGNQTTPGQYAEESTSLARNLSDVQTVLALVPLIRTGSAAALAARGAWGAGLDTTAATRGPGVIAQSMFGGQTAAQQAAGLGRRGLLNTRVLQNIPLLRQVGPAVGNLADADGLYYKARTLLAAPYRYGQVRAAGGAFQTAMMTGAALRGTAQAEQALGFTDPTTRSILRTDALNTVDLNIQRITHTPYAHPLTDAVDALGYVLHGPLGSTHVSQAIGDAVQNVTDHTSRLLGTVDVRGAWERAVTAASGKSTSIDDLQQAFGSPEHLDRFMNLKLADLAASHYAQHQAQIEGLTFGGDAGEAYRQRVGELADEVWNNPDLHVHAIKELLADPQELQNRIAADMVHNTTQSYAADAINWMTAGSHLTSTIRNGDARYLFGGDGKTLIANAQDAFDAGYGQDTPVRTLAVTRRDYVNQVTTLQSSLQRQVTVVRAKAGQDVADAEQALQANPADKSLQGTLSQAKARQAALETHLTNGDMRKFTETAKQVGPAVKSRFVWDRFIQDAHKLQHLTSQGTPEPLTFSHLVDTGVNPDELYTNINGEPRPFTENIGSGDWMRDHLQTPNGSLGLARLDTKSAQQATADIGRFRTRLEAGDENVMADMKNYGFREFGLTEKTLGAFSPERLADILDEYAHNLASEVFVAHDAPQSLKDSMQAMRDLGYRPMLGSHIGHTWDGSLPPMPELGAAISRRRKVAGVLGVTPDQITPRAAGMDARIRVLREVGKVQDQGGVFPPRHTAESVLSVLTDRNLLTPDMKLPEQLALRLTGKLHQRGIEQLARQRGITDMNKARAEYEGEIARGLQVRDIPRPEFIKALTDPGTFEGGATWQGVNQRTANLIHRAVLRGYADRPGYVIGASHLEDWMRGGFSFGGHISPAVRFANSELVQRAANLPNQLVIARNRMRFTLSPFFDWRRVSKQNYKMSLDGVNPVLNPLKHMVDNNSFDQAHDYVTKLLGEPQVTGFDDADRYLHQQSVWGMYNSRHFEAYYAWEKKLAGESDSEIRAGIHRVFDYGSAAKGGARSPLERTINTIFFPFSFEKTLLRNTGAYMLNHPQQALLLTGAMTAYNEANQNDQIHQWVQDHLPVLRDLQKLNAFAHGLSPGELGGINAPLLNLFMPQTWGKQLTVSNLKKNLPIFNDFGQLYHDVREQGVIGYNGLLNTADYAISLGAPRGTLDPYRPTITPEAQQRQASAKRNQFITALQPVLDYNAHTSDPASKATFPDDPRLPNMVRGQVVNRSTIGYLVKVWYPAYDPGSAARYAQAQATKADQYVNSIKDPQRKAEYSTFLKLANALQGHLQRGDYDTPEAAGIMQNFRDAALAASASDPTFYKFYNSHFRYLLGPLEQVKE